MALALFILMREKNIDIWKQKLDWIAKHGGMALVNTHPDQERKQFCVYFQKKWVGGALI